LYHEGTRYLSCLTLELDGQPPFFLGSTVRDQNDQLSVALTNPDRAGTNGSTSRSGPLHLAVRTLLWRGACHWRLRVRNHGPEPVEATIGLRFRADFADIFEVRGMRRRGPGAPTSSPSWRGAGDARVRRPRRAGGVGHCSASRRPRES